MPTDILYLINLNLKFKPIIKDRLFYDRYQYNISFQIDEASCLRELDHKYIDMMLDRRKAWREVAQQRRSRVSPQTIVTRRRKEITDKTVKDLHTIADALLTAGVDFKLVVSVETAWVYTNNIDLIKQLDQLDCLTKKTYTQAQINRPKNTIRLKNPEHKHRGYFKRLKLTLDQKNQLINFFINQTGYVRLSPALVIWCDGQFLRTQDYFFIDYNEESWAVMLALIHPGLLRKTVDLIAG